MRNVILTVAAIFALVAFITGCAESWKAETYLKQAGISGMHDVRRLQKVQMFNGSMGGAFFLGCGTVSGSLENEEKLQFSWAPKPNEYIFTSVSISKVRIVVVDTLTHPQIAFELRDGMYRYEYENAVINPNSMLETYELKLVRVYISPTMLASEPCLPQL